MRVSLPIVGPGVNGLISTRCRPIRSACRIFQLIFDYQFVEVADVTPLMCQAAVARLRHRNVNT
jgi:hypothetical protein